MTQGQAGQTQLTTPRHRGPRPTQPHGATREPDDLGQGLLAIQRMAGNAATRAVARGLVTPQRARTFNSVIPIIGADRLQRLSQPIQRQPEIRVTSGVTSELRRELRRLRQERAAATAGERDRYDEVIERLRIYIAERGNSSLRDCPVSLEFDGTSLTMNGRINTGRVCVPSLSFGAVSGKPNRRGGFDYSDARQRIRNKGPIPEGSYWLDPREMESLWLEGLVSGKFERAWGTHRITIHPFDTTATFGRGGFFIHGGSAAGSAGCIDLTGRMEAFAVALGRSVTGACKVKLDVQYPSP